VPLQAAFDVVTMWSLMISHQSRLEVGLYIVYTLVRASPTNLFTVGTKTGETLGVYDKMLEKQPTFKVYGPNTVYEFPLVLPTLT